MRSITSFENVPMIWRNRGLVLRDQKNRICLTEQYEGGEGEDFTAQKNAFIIYQRTRTAIDPIRSGHTCMHQMARLNRSNNKLVSNRFK